MQAARGATRVTELEAPRPTTTVRAGLDVVAVFGALTDATVDRALTAVVAAGLATRARERAVLASTPPTNATIGLQVPIALGASPGGHGTTVTGALDVHLATLTFDPTIAVEAAPAIALSLDVGDTDMWLIGGPGTTPMGGGLPMELRRLSARVEIGIHGGPSHSELVLHEGSALGATWDRLVIRPPTDPTGALETLPMLPEAQALIAALTTRLAAVAPGAAPAGIRRVQHDHVHAALGQVEGRRQARVAGADHRDVGAAIALEGPRFRQGLGGTPGRHGRIERRGHWVSPSTTPLSLTAPRAR
jgi:hypothetical protein